MADISPLAYDPNEFCSTREAARLLGVSLRTVQLWVESGVLQAWKTAGGHRRVKLKSLEKLLAQQQQGREQENVPTRSSSHGPDSPLKTLIVDDDESMLKLFELEMSGWDIPLHILTASNGFEGLIRIGETKPDLLISDMSMPGMDGARMIRTLRSDPQFQQMAIIVVTGLDVASVHAMGIPHDIPVFPKPVPFPLLSQAVLSALQSRNARLKKV